MKSFRHYSGAIAFGTFIRIAYAQTSSPTNSCGDDKNSSPGYTKLPDGKITYGLDDGGCYFCAEPTPGKVPLSGDDLSQSCQRLCDLDPDCVSFTVGRPATLPAQQYRFASMANCCMDRRRYPTGAFVDAAATSSGSRPNNCQHDAMCWTRYEKNERDVSTDHMSQQRQKRQQCEQDHVSLTQRESLVSVGQCAPVWEKTSYTDEQIRIKMDFIEDGCPRSSKTYKSMLAESYSQCRAEVLSESLGVSVVVSPLSIYAFVNVGGAYGRFNQTGWELEI